MAQEGAEIMCHNNFYSCIQMCIIVFLNCHYLKHVTIKHVIFNSV